MRTLANSLDGVVNYLLSEKCASVGVLAGAGVSVAAGIPDFRSPSGLYATLPVDLITATEAQRALIRAEPTSVVERTMFMQNSFPYLEVRRPFILGVHEAQWRPTAAHRFFEHLHTRGQLTRLFTQNIDGLDLLTTIPRERIVCVHGTLGRAACEACGEEAEFGPFAASVRECIKVKQCAQRAQMRRHDCSSEAPMTERYFPSSRSQDIYGVDVSAPAQSSHVLCASCGKPAVKPTTVLFGSALPEEFFARAETDLPGLDLLIIAGTSLMVSPANSLAARAQCPRVIINDQPVGQQLGLKYGTPAGEPACDVFLQGDVEQICAELLRRLRETAGDAGRGGEPVGPLCQLD